MRWIRRAISAGLTCCTGFGVSCAHNAASDLAKPPPFEPKDQTKCGVQKSPTRPLIVEWPSADRLALETQAKDGLVVVRYVGCDMEVLRHCHVKGAYLYVPATPQDDRVSIRDADELYATVPVHAAGLEATLSRSGELVVSMKLVGSFEAGETAVDAGQLEGDCAGATHVVTAMTAGAFEFFAQGAAAVGGGVSVGPVGAGGRSESSREMLNRAGDRAACQAATGEDKAPPFGCGALLRIEVAPIAGAQAGLTACEIALADEGCPRKPDLAHSFHDDWEHAGSDEARCMTRGKDWYSYCGGSGAVTARFLRAGKVVREERVESPTRCQITIPANGCPRDSKIAGVFNDDWESSRSDESRCLARAKDWYTWCGGSQAVTARFLSGASVVREARVETPTRCQVTLPDCPRKPEVAGLFNDDFETASTDEKRCAQRGREWFEWCGTDHAVIARFLRGETLVAETRTEATTRCQVTIPPGGCPRNPEVAGVFNDATENSGSDDARCMRRAQEWYSWCGGSMPVTARFYAAGKVQREQRAESVSRCQITLASCPKDASFAGVFNDDWESAGSDEARCMRRAREYDAWCGGAKATARFFRGGAMIREESSGK